MKQNKGLLTLKENLAVTKDNRVIPAGEKLNIMDVIEGNAVFMFAGQMMWASAQHFEGIDA